MKTILLTITATIISITGFSQWQTVGTTGFSAGSAQYLNLAVDNGTPYVAYKDGGNAEKCTVMKFDGSSWVNVGPAGFTTGIARDQSLVVVDGKPYVSFGDNDNSNKARVMTYNGTSWELVGDFVSNATTYGTSMAIHDSIIYVASVGGGNAYLYKYQDSLWSQVSFYPASMGGAQDIDLAIHPSNGTPYVTYRDNYNGGKISVVKPNSSGGWDNIGPLGFSTNQVRTPKIIFKDDVPHVAYRDVSTDKITVMKYDGGWSVVGSSGFSAGSIISPSLAIHDGKATVAYSDAVNDDGATVMYYNGADWSDKESNSASDGKATDQQLVSDNGELFLAYLDWENGEKLTVKQFVECDLNASVSFAGSSLTANTDSASYQWMDCGSFATIAGETAQTFTPTENGSYAVIVTDGICVDTSACTSITVGIVNAANSALRLYPNPANKIIMIDADEAILNYSVMNTVGVQLFTGRDKQVDLSDLSSGLYLINIETSTGIQHKTFIKN